MTQILPVYRAIQFIEKNLTADIAVADIAEAASFSVYHFCRVFAQVVHHSPYDYLMRRRLSEAARELVETDKKITDIGFDYQFNSPETFSRAFKRMFDVQPSRWKKQNCLGSYCLLPAFSLEYLEHINQGDYLKPVFAQKDTLHLAGLMTLDQDDSLEAVNELWDMLRTIQESSSLEEKYYGVVWYPEGKQNSFFYMAAIETKSSDVVRPGLVTKTIPASTYARFIHKGPWAARRLTLDYIYQTWLPQSGQRLGGLPEVERYAAGVPEMAGIQPETKIYIPLAKQG
jgi:AraC family transcriptional regulator